MSISPRAVFALWPTLEAVSDDFRSAGFDISSTRVSKWAQRNRIPPQYWLPLVTIASQRGLKGVTLNMLAVMHSLEPAEGERA
jgi:hypothetical protein